MITTILLPLLISKSDLQDAGKELRYMQSAVYLARSPKEDSESAGGFAVAGELPQPFHRQFPWHGGMGVAVIKEKDRPIRLYLVNYGLPDDWIPAVDSNLQIYLEAADPSGKWSPIQYHTWGMCGNSYHRVAIPRDTFWSWEVPFPKGDFKTRLRAVFYDGKYVLRSGEIEVTIPREKFELPPSVSKSYRVQLDGKVPTLVPKGLLKGL